MTTRLGVIGGSGLYDLENLDNVATIEIDTPFGTPSGPITTGNLHGMNLAFLPRHGPGHRLNPSEVPYRANIHAMKQLGVTHLLSISAVGSLTESYPPLTLVCPDQIIDRTITRDRTFFDDGIVAHVGIAEPFCRSFIDIVIERASGAGATVVRGGAYLCIEGPQFSTKAESSLFRAWGASVVGMTAMPEARLAREAELCYAQISMVTDFDVWHESEEPVTVAMVIANLHKNSASAKRVLSSLCAGGTIPDRGCGCSAALQFAIATNPDQISDSVRNRLSVIAGKYLP